MFTRGAKRVALASSVLALLVGVTYAQQEWRPWGRGYGWSRMPPRFPTPDSFDGSFNFCRVMYQSVRREESGMGWWTDYPSADINFSIRLSELTKANVSFDRTGEPNHLVVRLTDDALYQCPFVLMEDVGTVGLSDLEIERFRDYLVKGGFLWVDDFWGTRAWEMWEREIAKVLPPSEYPIGDLHEDHPLFKTLFEVDRVPQVPHIQFWRQSGHKTSERGRDSENVHVRGISDHDGRLMVLMTHNTDIADSWEREGEESEYFYSFSIDGYAVAINALMYAMTH